MTANGSVGDRIRPGELRPDLLSSLTRPASFAGDRTAARTAILREAEAALGRLVDPAARGQAARFLGFWSEGVATEDLLERSAEDIAGAALSLWDLALQRTQGAATVRVRQPRAATEGWRTRNAIAEIVTDDMPFLVDSAVGALAQAGRQVHLVVHPILTVERDAKGRALDFHATDASSGSRESLIQIAFAAGDAAELAAVASALKRAMADVRGAVSAFPAMRDRLAEAARTLTLATGGFDPAERDEAVAFLDWLGQDHFVLLGARRYALEPDGTPRIVPQSGLGVLASPSLPVWDVMRDPASVPDAVRIWLRTPLPISVAKANMRATVHRSQHADTVLVQRFDAAGKVEGADLFFGLFASDAYNRSPRSIPVLRRKVAAVIERAGTGPDTHDGRSLRNILETWPRDELFQATVEELYQAARGVLPLAHRQRVALFARPDRFERYVSALVYVPRDLMDTRLRERVGAMLAEAYAGRLSTAYVQLGDTPLARIHFIIATTPGSVPRPDLEALERAMAEVARNFRDRLARVLESEHGEARASHLLARWGDAMPAGYAEDHTAAEAMADIAAAEAALSRTTEGDGRLEIALSRPPGAPASSVRLRIVHAGGAVPLSQILPLIESLGLSAVTEQPYHLRPAAAPEVVLHVFTLRDPTGAAIELDTVAPALEAALDALWRGAVEVDGFNRLVLRAGLGWREAWLLRALQRWLKQIGFAFSGQAVAAALDTHPDAARLLLRRFSLRFDPSSTIARTAEQEASIDADWSMLLDTVENPDEDRILSRLMTALSAVLRTDFYAPRDPSVIALKLDSPRAGDMPSPRPFVEIFVHGARMEGCHLRGGKVARGGLRWSDRREDFRTEILGLMKAQQVKNAVIVPVGAKGGFVLKKPPTPTGEAGPDRDATLAEGIACYRLLVGSMLDLADSYDIQGAIVPCRHLRRDGDDPYIVAAADKGTAAFSDIANGLSADRDFWMGDAFASGGSQGYDHKKLGITAKGAFVCLARHFREMGVDLFRDPVTVAGVGDMSGDVFGNGLLESPNLRLLAAFDHRHIFLDPDPDPATAFAERQRLFALPRSAWSDYDRAAMSRGGIVLDRRSKTVALTPEVMALLRLTEPRSTPETVLKAILRLPVDLLYFGGIGTYLKASTESQADAGDRANDGIRIDATELQAKVVGEGANLAVTMAARIEASLRGIRIDTDALHNSGGVDCSDHEVNIKIALAPEVAAGRLDPAARSTLLAAMAGEVSAHVLATNFAQALAVSLDTRHAAQMASHARLLGLLETEGRLDRAVAGLPNAATLRRRALDGRGLTRPEAGTLMAFAKLWLFDAILEDGIALDPAVEPDLVRYFPTQLRERFGGAIERHRLRAELIATILSNELVNRLGITGIGVICAEAGAPPGPAARAALAAREAFGLAARWDAALAAEAQGATVKEIYPRLIVLRRIQRGGTRWFLRHAGGQGIAEAARPYREPMARIWDELIARDPGGAATGSAGPEIVRLSAEGASMPASMDAWFAAGAAFGPDQVRGALARLPTAGSAVALIEDEVGDAQARLARSVLEQGSDSAVQAKLGARWTNAERALRLLAASEAEGEVAQLSAALSAARAIGALA